jgi:flagellar hook-associated protein FlgK
MSNLLTSLSSAAGAMSTYEKALEVVQNDTVNVNTPGYVRQSVNFTARPFNLNRSVATVRLPNVIDCGRALIEPAAYF